MAEQSASGASNQRLGFGISRRQCWAPCRRLAMQKDSVRNQFQIAMVQSSVVYHQTAMLDTAGDLWHGRAATSDLQGTTAQHLLPTARKAFTDMRTAMLLTSGGFLKESQSQQPKVRAKMQYSSTRQNARM